MTSEMTIMCIKRFAQRKGAKRCGEIFIGGTSAAARAHLAQMWAHVWTRTNFVLFSTRNLVATSTVP